MSALSNSRLPRIKRKTLEERRQTPEIRVLAPQDMTHLLKNHVLIIHLLKIYWPRQMLRIPPCRAAEPTVIEKIHFLLILLIGSPLHLPWLLCGGVLRRTRLAPLIGRLPMSEREEDAYKIWLEDLTEEQYKALQGARRRDQEEREETVALAPIGLLRGCNRFSKTQ